MHVWHHETQILGIALSWPCLWGSDHNVHAFYCAVRPLHSEGRCRLPKCIEANWWWSHRWVGRIEAPKGTSCDMLVFRYFNSSKLVLVIEKVTILLQQTEVKRFYGVYSWVQNLVSASQMQYFTERVKHAPSLLGLSSLRVIGDVWFGKDVVLQVHTQLGHSGIFHFTPVREEFWSACVGLRSDFLILFFCRERLLSGPRKMRGLRSRMVR